MLAIRNLAVALFVYDNGNVTPVYAELPRRMSSALLSALYERFGKGSGTASREQVRAAVRLGMPEAPSGIVNEEAEKTHLWEVPAPHWPGVLAAVAAYEGQRKTDNAFAPLEAKLREHGPHSAVLLHLEYDGN